MNLKRLKLERKEYFTFLFDGANLFETQFAVVTDRQSWLRPDQGD
jgi:hypothetical protein